MRAAKITATLSTAYAYTIAWALGGVALRMLGQLDAALATVIILVSDSATIHAACTHANSLAAAGISVRSSIMHVDTLHVEVDASSTVEALPGGLGNSVAVAGLEAGVYA